jgi:hypothetical protein
MHTLQSEPILFADTPECHELITDTFDETVALVKANASEEVYGQVLELLTECGQHIFKTLEEEGMGTDFIVQAMIERLVITTNNFGETPLACFVGVYFAPKDQQEADGLTEAKLATTFALTVDPTTRRFISVCPVARDDEDGMRIVH